MNNKNSVWRLGKSKTKKRMGSKNPVVLVAGTILMMSCASAMADWTLNYQHQYAEKKKKNVDKVMISKSLENNLTFSLQAVMGTADTNSGEPGKAFSRLTKDSIKGKVGYSYKFGDDFKIKPKFTYTHGKAKKSYKPSLKIGYSLTDRLTVTPGYNQKITHYDEHGQRSKRDEVWKVGVKYKFDRLTMGAGHKRVHSNTILYDNDNNNYSNKLAFEYKVTKQFRPYFQLSDVYVSKKTDERQARYRLGFKYKF